MFAAIILGFSVELNLLCCHKLFFLVQYLTHSNYSSEDSLVTRI